MKAFNHGCASGRIWCRILFLLQYSCTVSLLNSKPPSDRISITTLAGIILRNRRRDSTTFSPVFVLWASRTLPVRLPTWYNREMPPESIRLNYPFQPQFNVMRLLKRLRSSKAQPSRNEDNLTTLSTGMAPTIPGWRVTEQPYGLRRLLSPVKKRSVC